MGNILLLDDGKVGLIDYGQVKVLSAIEREQVLKLYKSIRAGRKDEVVETVVRMGYQSERSDPEVTWQRLRFVLDRDDIIPRGWSPPEYMHYLMKEDPLIKYP